MYKIIGGAIIAIFVAMIGASALSALPDPNRMVVNSLPNTTPDVKSVANTALDIKDTASNLQDTMSMWKNVYVLMLGIGVPSAVIGGLVLRAFR